MNSGCHCASLRTCGHFIYILPRKESSLQRQKFHEQSISSKETQPCLDHNPTLSTSVLSILGSLRFWVWDLGATKAQSSHSKCLSSVHSKALCLYLFPFQCWRISFQLKSPLERVSASNSAPPSHSLLTQCLLPIRWNGP